MVWCVVWCSDVYRTNMRTSPFSFFFLQPLQSEWKNLRSETNKKDNNNTSKTLSTKEEDLKQKMKEYNTEGARQYLPNEKSGVSYISRLECMQAAVDTHLKRLNVQYPNKTVLLLTFNNEVTFVGDGACQPTTITGTYVVQPYVSCQYHPHCCLNSNGGYNNDFEITHHINNKGTNWATMMS